MSLPSVSAVVPVHDGAETLPELCARLFAVLQACARTWEVILVNDGSRDASWAVIEGLCARQPQLRAFDLAENVGQHGALLCGVRAARGEWIVTLDDDLQHPPEVIPQLLRAGLDGADLVYGSAPNPDQGLLRRLAARGARRLLARETGTDAAHLAGALRCFRALPAEALARDERAARRLDVPLLRTATRVVAVPVRLERRRHGASGYGTMRLIALALGFPLHRRRSAAGTQPYAVRATLNGGR